MQPHLCRESGQVITNSNVKSLCEVFCFVDLSSHSTSNPVRRFSLVKAALTSLPPARVTSSRITQLQDLFRQPMALTKLGMFLRERRAWTGRRNPDKAIVIVSPEDNANRCQLLCITGQPKITDTKVKVVPLSGKEPALKASDCRAKTVTRARGNSGRDVQGNQMLDLLGATAEKMGGDINNDSINEVPTVRQPTHCAPVRPARIPRLSFCTVACRCPRTWSSRCCRRWPCKRPPRLGEC